MQVEDIRTVIIDGEKWYVARDVASVLGYKDVGSPLQYRFDSTDKKKHKIFINNRKHDIIIINKHGLESLVSRSSKPNAISVAKKLGIKVNKMWPKPKKLEDIRTVIIDGEKWYVARDVASVLGYVSLSDAVQAHVDDEDKTKGLIRSGKHNHSMILINKHGFEELLSSSILSNAISIAKKFNIQLNYMLDTYRGQNIRNIIIDGTQWFVAKDVAKILGYKGLESTIRQKTNKEDRMSRVVRSGHHNCKMILINKHGLESLVSSSKMPHAINIAKKLGINIKANRKRKKPTKVEDVRTVIIDGKKWYVGIDVASVLGYKSLGNTVNYYIDDKDKKKYKIRTYYGIKDIIIINKHGLEVLVSSSITPNAINVAQKLDIQLNYMLDTYRGQNIRNIIIDGKLWFASKDVVKTLGYKDIESAIYHNTNEEDRIKRVVRSGNHNCKMVLINKHGLEGLLSKSILPNALDIAKKLGINVNHILNTRKEQDSIHAILKTFKGENMVRQYSVGTYYIDLYFPKYKLAIECDEFGHADRDQEYEQTRQHYIEDKLGCKFIRYNPDSKNYNIFNVLNRIYKEISKN